MIDGDSGSVVIRPLTAADGVAYRELMLRAYREHDSAFTSTFDERVGMSTQWWAQRLGDPTSLTLGAFAAFDSGALLIGSVRLERYARAREQHKVQITAMYVLKDCAGRGIGRQLLEAALLNARSDTAVEHATLTVTADNHSAVRLYESLGFRTFGCELRAVKTARGYIDKLHMSRSVSDDS